MKAIQFKGNTPAIEAFMGEDVAALQRICNEKCVIIGLTVHTKNQELNFCLNEWLVKDDDKYYTLNTDSYTLLKSKQDRIDGLKEMIK